LLTTDIAKLRDLGIRWARKKYATLNEAEREDVVQDALIRMVDKAPDPALLAAVMDGLAKNLIRAKARRAKVELPGGDANDLSILSDNRGRSIDSAIFAADFNRALRDLSEDDRAAFILYELRGLTAYEAALYLGVPPTTVNSRVESAKGLLRKEL